MSKPGEPLVPVLVRWIDPANHDNGWIELKGVDPESFVCETVGYLISAGDDATVLVSSLGHHGSEELYVESVMSIPSGCIKSLTYLEEGK